jgi:hypothetical protein
MEANNAYPAPSPASALHRSPEQKAQEALRVAGEMFRQGPDWVTFLREVLGVGGAVRNLFPTHEELAWFEQTEEYAEVQHMVAQLRTQVVATTAGDDKEPTRVITVRLPKSLHELLRKEAHDRSTSMNKLCISKLLQVIDEGLVPNDLGNAVNSNQVTIMRVDEAHVQQNEPHRASPERTTGPEAVHPPHLYEGSQRPGQ